MNTIGAKPEDRATSRWYPFAGTLFILVGGINALQGLIAIFKDDYFAITKRACSSPTSPPGAPSS